jgi:hypothetical protein
MEESMTTYVVTLREGTLCRAKGLEVTYHGHDAHVSCKTGAERDTFWAVRLAFLRANPQAA